MSKCPKCDKPAYVGLLEVKCSNSACDLYDASEPARTPTLTMKPIQLELPFPPIYWPLP